MFIIRENKKAQAYVSSVKISIHDKNSALILHKCWDYF